MDDQSIINLYWARSETAISESEKKYGNYCRYIAGNILAYREDIQECVNDTYLKAWESMPPHRPGKLGAFLGRITRNLSLNRWKELHTQKRGGGQTLLALEELSFCIPESSDEEKLLDKLELSRILNQFLERLSPDARKIFMQRYWYMCSIRQIADNLGFTESKVKMSLTRSREALRQTLCREGIDL